MGNLLKDVESETVDLVVHMGDHAYSIGEGDERRDDAYMAAFEPVIANCPWMPIVGIVSVGRIRAMSQIVSLQYQSRNDLDFPYMSESFLNACLICIDGTCR